MFRFLKRLFGKCSCRKEVTFKKDADSLCLYGIPFREFCHPTKRLCIKDCDGNVVKLIPPPWNVIEHKEAHVNHNIIIWTVPSSNYSEICLIFCECGKLFFRSDYFEGLRITEEDCRHWATFSCKPIAPLKEKINDHNG